MQPAQLKAEQFASYPPQARALVVAHLATLQQLPLSFLPGLLREAIEYDFKFPAERVSIDHEFANLDQLSSQQIAEWFKGFSQVPIPTKLERFDWIDQPSQFVEQLSAYLWSTHQLDAYREAATVYGDRLRGTQAKAAPVRRLGIAVIGQGVASYDAPLFRNLRKHGTYFGKVNPEGGLEQLLAAVAERAKADPMPYGHWYVDGGQAAAHAASLTCVSYQAMEPVRVALLKNMQAEIARPGMGPEELRTHLARLAPGDIGIGKTGDAVLERFQLKLLTEGSGTQIFSTAFAQWTTREVLRRAEAHTLLVRFAPRQRQRPMNEMLSGSGGSVQLDPAGSLIDADMAAYYHWINQQRLPGSEHSAFLIWFEGHNQALAIAPSLPKGTESLSVLDLSGLFKLATA